MSSSPECLVIIPARGGSQGIPMKNISDLCGKPLIAYTIECARKSKYATRIIVSTDDEDIASFARQFGAETPFMRPKGISGSSASIEDAVHHTIKELTASGYQADIHCILLPTHIFRQPKMINCAVEKILGGHHEVHTVRRFPDGISVWCGMDKNKNILPLTPKKVGEEWAAGWFRPYGCLSMYSAVQNPKGAYLCPLLNPIEFIDIDTSQDLEIAKLVIENNLYDFDLE